MKRRAWRRRGGSSRTISRSSGCERTGCASSWVEREFSLPPRRVLQEFELISTCSTRFPTTDRPYRRLQLVPTWLRTTSKGSSSRWPSGELALSVLVLNTTRQMTDTSLLDSVASPPSSTSRPSLRSSTESSELSPSAFGTATPQVSTAPRVRPFVPSLRPLFRPQADQPSFFLPRCGPPAHLRSPPAQHGSPRRRPGEEDVARRLRREHDGLDPDLGGSADSCDLQHRVGLNPRGRCCKHPRRRCFPRGQRRRIEPPDLGLSLRNIR